MLGRGSSGRDFYCSSLLAKEAPEWDPRMEHYERLGSGPGPWDKVNFLGSTVDSSRQGLEWKSETI